MIFRLLEKLRRAKVEDTGRTCPACGSSETDKVNGIWHCKRCDYEW